MKCQKCNLSFPERKIELSHDIPKYIDLFGKYKKLRHNLCEDCHDKYERTILSNCMIKLFNQLVPFSEDRRKYIPYMIRIKHLKNSKKIEIALEIRRRFFEGDT